MFHSEQTREAKPRAETQRLISIGQRIAEISFFANIVLGLIEVIFGMRLGSLALTADGIHSFVDAIVSMTVWLGIRYSRKKADGMFHYGYYKFDAIFSLFAAMIMVASGLVISYVGFVQFLKPEITQPISFLGGAVAGLSIMVAVVLAVAKNLYARRTGLVSLKTDALNSVKDALAAVVALVGIIATWFGFYALDPAAALVIGVFVMVAGYFAIKESSLILADAYSNPGMVDTIKNITTSVSGIKAIGELRVRRQGPLLTIELHILVDGNITVFEADKISIEVSKRMHENIVSLGRITIKPEPVQAAQQRLS